MLQPAARNRLDAPSAARDQAVRELKQKPKSRLALEFAQSGGQTRLAHVWQEPPWKVVRSFSDRSGAALVHLHNISGGLLSGDRLESSIDIGRRCEAQITTTGSTRIYKARDGGAAAAQELHATVREGALLEHIPDSIIPFAHSRFLQRSTFELSADAGLFAWEVIAPGRSGEAFAFDTLQVETHVRSSGKPIAIDSWSVQPRLRRVAEAIRLHTFSYQATFYVCRAGMAAGDWLIWEKAMAETISERESPNELWGVSALQRDGMVFRGLANEGCYLIDSLVCFWRRMKTELYGREPVLPRKMF